MTETQRLRDALKQIANGTVPASVHPDLAVRYEKFAAGVLAEAHDTVLQPGMWYGVRQIGASLVAVTVAENRHSLALLIARDAGAEYVASWSGEAWVDVEPVR
jgi:hypothetical protein